MKKIKYLLKKQTSKSPIQDANCDGHQGPAFQTNICSTEQSFESSHRNAIKSGRHG